MKQLYISIIGLVLVLASVSDVAAKQPKPRKAPNVNDLFTTQPQPRPNRISDPCSFQYCGVVIPETPRKRPRK